MSCFAVIMPDVHVEHRRLKIEINSQQSKQGKGIHSTYALKAIHLKLLLIYCHFQQKIPLNGGLESGGYYNSM